MADLLLVYDTETTGLPLWKEPSDHPGQPHIVQIGARLIHAETRVPVMTLDTIVRPNGWTIPDEVASIHGITTERAMQDGIEEEYALSLLRGMWNLSNLRVAHNESFDARILRIAFLRHRDPVAAEKWAAGRSACTALMSSPILNLPPTDRMKAAGFDKPKMPKLTEAYRHFFGKDFEGAHTALADVDACAAVYFAMLDGKAVAA